MCEISNFCRAHDSALTVINKELYSKVFFIELDHTDAVLNVVDNNDNFVTLFCENGVNTNYGFSLNTKQFFYRSNLTDEIFFSLNVIPFYNNYSIFLKKFNSLLICLEKYKLKKVSSKKVGITILKTIRGGYNCFYIGVLGFLPREQFFYVFSNLKLKNKYNYTLKHFLTLFSKNYYSFRFKKICCLFTVRFKTLKFYYRQLKGVKKKKIKKFRKKKRYFGELNIVFKFDKIVKQHIKQEHEAKCTIKKTKKSTYKKYVKFAFFHKKYE